MRERLEKALADCVADYAEIRFETEDATSLGYRGREFDSVRTARFSGGIARACIRGGWGIAVFDSIDDLADRVGDACRMARLVGREKTALAPNGSRANAEKPAAMERDFRGVALDDKIALVRRYNDIVLSTNERVETSHVSYSEIFRTVFFASTEGAWFMEERPRVTLSVRAIARKGALVQQAYDSASSAADYRAVTGLENRAEETAKRAVALLAARPCPGGAFTVVLDQELGGVFAHEAFGHLSEADFLYENPKMRDLMHLGRRMGPKELSIVDEGSRGSLLGTQAYDDEGTPTGKTYLIREGVLAGHLHSRETAAKMGALPTGNARAYRRDMPPIVRMTNTYIEAGETGFADLVRGIDRGIYACRALGGMTAMEMFTFSAGYGHMIESGAVGELVRDVVLSGNVFETLANIDGFGNDLAIIEGSGGCGKGRQSPLPISLGAPHLRIRNVLIGGTG